MSKIQLLNVSEFRYLEDESDSDVLMKISGVAVTAGIHNGATYPADELKKGVEGHKGKLRLHVDHSRRVADVVGDVTNLDYVPKKEEVTFKASVYDVDAARKIKLGLVDSFSVGLDVDVGVDKKTKVEYVYNIDFKEISLVTHPADERAKIATIMSEQVKPLGDEIRKQMEVELMEKEELEKFQTELTALKEQVKVLEEAKPDEPPKEEPKDEPEEKKPEEKSEEKPEEKKEEPAEPAKDEKAETEMTALKDNIKELEKKVEELNAPDRRIQTVNPPSDTSLECGPLVIDNGVIFRKEDQ